jgi:gamma-glutamyltranspeptidase / glutathione hydrolase
MRQRGKQLKSSLSKQRNTNTVILARVEKSPLFLTLLLLSLLTISPGLSAEKQAPIINYQQRFVPVIGQNGMVVSPEELAAEVGRQILEDGGNAIDAAVATGFALAVTYPRAGNLGGGGFMLIHLAEDNRQTFIDYRETAPASATADMFLNEQGEIDRQREYFSHQSAGVPGTVAGLLYAQEKYGLLSRERVLAPAVALAREGLMVTFSLNYEISARKEQLARNNEASRLFLQENGTAPEIGTLWKQPDLAFTLEQIQKKGSKGFYEGSVAELIATEMQRGEGLITAQDLKNYRAVERTPVSGTYRGFQVVSAPPPSSGGIHIIQMLNILEGFDLNAMGHNSAAYLHHLTESMKLAYADRSQYLGDTDFVEVPIQALTSKEYANRQRKFINPGKAAASKDILPGKALPQESTETTHYSVADKLGNVVSNTYTLNFSFGSHIAVPGTGMLLNNEMADFAAKPGLPNAYGLVQGDANKIEPQKRPLSSMSPTLVLKDGKPWLTTGSPGGSIIINTVLQTILNAMEFGMNVAAAAAEPRIHHQWMPDKLNTEQGISPDTLSILKARGHNVVEGRRTQGRTNSIMIENGWFYGATDTRRPGGWVATY